MTLALMVLTAQTAWADYVNYIGADGTQQSVTAIVANRHSISIYAQSTGANKGQLHVYGSKYGIYAAEGGAVNIGGGQVAAKGTSKYGISSDRGSNSNEGKPFTVTKVETSAPTVDLIPILPVL